MVTTPSTQENKYTCLNRKPHQHRRSKLEESLVIFSGQARRSSCHLHCHHQARNQPRQFTTRLRTICKGPAGVFQFSLCGRDLFICVLAGWTNVPVSPLPCTVRHRIGKKQLGHSRGSVTRGWCDNGPPQSNIGTPFCIGVRGLPSYTGVRHSRLLSYKEKIGKYQATKARQHSKQWQMPCVTCMHVSACPKEASRI